MYDIIVHTPKGSPVEVMSANTDACAFMVYETTCEAYSAFVGYEITSWERPYLNRVRGAKKLSSYISGK